MPFAIKSYFPNTPLILGSSTALSGTRSLQKSFELSERETDIARALAAGLTSREIAGKLHLTQGTVKNYLSGIYSKIGTNDRAKAVLVCQQLFGQKR